MKIKLGQVYRDKISTYQGVAIGKTEWLNGCVRIGLQAQKCGTDGKPVDDLWVDIEQLESVCDGPMKTGTPSGGPMPDPVFPKGR